MANSIKTRHGYRLPDFSGVSFGVYAYSLQVGLQFRFGSMQIFLLRTTGGPGMGTLLGILALNIPKASCPHNVFV